jgi:hypothetical protein
MRKTSSWTCLRCCWRYDTCASCCCCSVARVKATTRGHTVWGCGSRRTTAARLLEQFQEESERPVK